jgi:hypothetical protein
MTYSRKVWHASFNRNIWWSFNILRDTLKGREANLVLLLPAGLPELINPLSQSARMGACFYRTVTCFLIYDA